MKGRREPMVSIAICVPTYNHPDVVEDVLEKSIDTYRTYGIDVYYFDSSEQKDTKNVIEKYRMLGYDNLFYVSIDSELGPHIKIELMFEGIGLEKQYDFIWPAKDRVYFPQSTLERVLDAGAREYDVIFLEAVNSSSNLEMLYEEPVEFYNDWGWLATSMDGVIYNKKKMLLGFTREQFEKEVKGYHNIYWAAFVCLFKNLAVGKRKIMALGLENDALIRGSSLGKSTWEKLTFTVWKDYWVAVNEELPSCYDKYKAKVIKQTTTLPWIIGSTSRLVHLHEAGVLTPDTFEDIIVDWDKVSDVPVNVVRQIAWGEFDIYHNLGLFKKNTNKSIAVLADLVEVIRNGSMTLDEIPFDDIKQIIKFEMNFKRYSEEKMCIVIGSVSDIENYIYQEGRTLEEIGNALQVLVSMLLLM